MIERSETNDQTNTKGGRGSRAHCRRDAIPARQAVAKPRARAAEFRFYGILNDFLPWPRHQRETVYRFDGCPGIKDPIEALGVPHTEVELILVHGRSVNFDYRLQDGDRVSVYPPFGTLDIGPLARLREKPLVPIRFIVDVNLGRLARRLRRLGHDSLYRNDYRDADIVRIAAGEHRIVLTRDRRLLHAKRIVHGYWVRAVAVDEQLDEVARRYDLDAGRPDFSRCMVCNGRLAEVDKADVWGELEPKTRLYYEVFFRCEGCRRIYWEGSHVDRMRNGRNSTAAGG